MAKDFFDEEYEKQQAERPNQGSAGGPNNWYTDPAPAPSRPKNKAWWIVLLCFALVACIALGFVSCALLQNAAGLSRGDENEQILAEVMDYLRDYYYRDISDEQWANAVEKAGTSLMQNAGDRFCRLMSPQTYYDFVNPSATLVSEEIFGADYVVEEGLGLRVTSVVTDSAAFGKLQVGDWVLKLGNMRTIFGRAPVFGDEVFEEMYLSQWTTDSINMVMSVTHSADFYVLRQNPSSESGFDIVKVSLTRAPLPQLNTGYDFQFVEFYFGPNDTNVSTSTNKPFGATTTTQEQRRLDLLPSDTGYVRIKEFSDYLANENGTYVKHTAAEEFRQVMELFKQRGLKHLVLDLKGNPGGTMAYVCDIASMLVGVDHLTAEQKQQVVNQNGELLITYLVMPKPSYVRENQYKASAYNSFFEPMTEKCDIVVWTDGGSASASELLTGCLRDYKTAVQMGTTTYGKGIAQTWQELPFKGDVTDVYGNTTSYPWAVYFTCANYYSPLGENIHGVGYTPDAAYNNLSDYAQLWAAAASYWG